MQIGQQNDTEVLPAELPSRLYLKIGYTMQLNIHELKRDLYGRYLRMLSIYRMVDTNAFSAAFKVAGVEEQKQAMEFINAAKQFELERWVREVLINNQLLEHLDTRTLRNVCLRVGVSNYSRMTKEEMISLIRARNASNYVFNNQPPESGVAYVDADSDGQCYNLGGVEGRRMDAIGGSQGFDYAQQTESERYGESHGTTGTEPTAEQSDGDRNQEITH